MSKRTDCFARQYGDQMFCPTCKLTWDTNDSEPPNCQKVDRRTKFVKSIEKFEAPKVEVKQDFPEVLSSDIADEMVMIYEKEIDPVKGMKMAYRLLIDRIKQ